MKLRVLGRLEIRLAKVRFLEIGLFDDETLHQIGKHCSFHECSIFAHIKAFSVTWLIFCCAFLGFSQMITFSTQHTMVKRLLLPKNQMKPTHQKPVGNKVPPFSSLIRLCALFWREFTRGNRASSNRIHQINWECKCHLQMMGSFYHSVFSLPRHMPYHMLSVFHAII